jgi:hypothetical protein
VSFCSSIHQAIKHCTYINVGFEVLTAVVVKNIIFWDVTPCSLLRCNRRFGETYRVHLQGRRKLYQHEPASTQMASKMFLLKFFFDPEDGGDVFLRNVGCISTDYTASHPRRLYSFFYVNVGCLHLVGLFEIEFPYLPINRAASSSKII